MDPEKNDEFQRVKNLLLRALKKVYELNRADDYIMANQFPCCGECGAWESEPHVKGCEVGELMRDAELAGFDMKDIRKT